MSDDRAFQAMRHLLAAVQQMRDEDRANLDFATNALIALANGVDDPASYALDACLELGARMANPSYARPVAEPEEHT